MFLELFALLLLLLRALLLRCGARAVAPSVISVRAPSIINVYVSSIAGVYVSIVVPSIAAPSARLFYRLFPRLNASILCISTPPIKKALRLLVLLDFNEPEAAEPDGEPAIRPRQPQRNAENSEPDQKTANQKTGQKTNKPNIKHYI